MSLPLQHGNYGKRNTIQDRLKMKYERMTIKELKNEFENARFDDERFWIKEELKNRKNNK